MWGVTKLAGYMEKKLPADHVVLKHLPAVLAHANQCAELPSGGYHYGSNAAM
jgi:hypothetical protein